MEYYIYIKKECVEVSECYISNNPCIVGLKRNISNINLVIADDNIGIFDEKVRQTIHLALFDLIRDEDCSIVSLPYID